MDRDQSWQVIDGHRAMLADLLASLSPEQWESPSLCPGWRVRDVGAHLSLAATASAGEVLRGAVAARGNPDRMIRDVSIARGQRPTSEIVSDLRSIIGSRKLAPTTFWRDPLLDILVHAHDIARPLGIAIETPPDAARVAAEWAWQRRFPFFPARRLRGFALVADDVDWSRGSGEEVSGPITSLLLLSTGRAAGLDDLDGRPAAALADRFR
ncbi:MAG: maleylpyruvate isomerase family mycothiol-dependent enzyme [Nocardioides sp.]